jgi:hypothetical protein
MNSKNAGIYMVWIDLAILGLLAVDVWLGFQKRGSGAA